MRQKGLIRYGTLRELEAFLGEPAGEGRAKYACICPGHQRAFWRGIVMGYDRTFDLLSSFIHLEGCRWDGIVVACPHSLTDLNAHARPSIADSQGWIFVIEPLPGGYVAPPRRREKERDPTGTTIKKVHNYHFRVSGAGAQLIVNAGAPPPPPELLSVQDLLCALYTEGGSMEHNMPPTVATVAAAEGQRVLRFSLRTPHGFDGNVSWHTSDTTLGHLEFSDERQASGWVVSHGVGGAAQFTARLDGAVGAGVYIIHKGLHVTFVPEISTGADLDVEVLVAPTPVDPDPVPEEPPIEPGDLEPPLGGQVPGGETEPPAGETPPAEPETPTTPPGDGGEQP